MLAKQTIWCCVIGVLIMILLLQPTFAMTLSQASSNNGNRRAFNLLDEGGKNIGRSLNISMLIKTINRKYAGLHCVYRKDDTEVRCRRRDATEQSFSVTFPETAEEEQKWKLVCQNWETNDTISGYIEQFMLPQRNITCLTIIDCQIPSYTNILSAFNVQNANALSIRTKNNNVTITQQSLIDMDNQFRSLKEVMFYGSGLILQPNALNSLSKIKASSTIMSEPSGTSRVYPFICFELM